MLLATQVQSTLDNPTSDDGRLLGRCLSSYLTAKLGPSAAVGKWCNSCPALTELENNFPFFRPTFNVIAKHLIQQSSWGSKRCLYVNALLSIFDMITDLSMIVKYAK